MYCMCLLASTAYLNIYLQVNSSFNTEMFKVTFPSGRTVIPALIVVDMQNGFVAKGGSYDRIGMNTPLYREIIPKLKDLIEFCRAMEIPVFYTEAVKESSGIDLLTR